MSEIYKKALAFRALDIELRQLKDVQLPSRTPVFVDAPRYTGYGIVSRYDEPADQVAVRLGNGNVWWYPVECVKRVAWKEVHPENRREYLRMRGIGTAGFGPRKKLP